MTKPFQPVFIRTIKLQNDVGVGGGYVYYYLLHPLKHILFNATKYRIYSNKCPSHYLRGKFGQMPPKMTLGH